LESEGKKLDAALTNVDKRWRELTRLTSKTYSRSLNVVVEHVLSNVPFPLILLCQAVHLIAKLLHNLSGQMAVGIRQSLHENGDNH
jgi:hypothetical protein